MFLNNKRSKMERKYSENDFYYFEGNNNKQQSKLCQYGCVFNDIQSENVTQTGILQ